MASAFSDVDSGLKLAAGLVGGSLALTTHSAKASARLAVNSSPEPFSNTVLSVLEDAATVGFLGLAATHPWLAAAALILLLLLSLLLLYLCAKFTRILWKRLQGWFGASEQPGATNSRIPNTS